MENDPHPRTAFVVDPFPSPCSAPNPRLSDVQPRRVRDLKPAAVVCPDFLGLRKGLPVDLAQAHAAARDGEVAGLLEDVLDLGAHLLLGPLHLGDGLVDRLAGDLAGQHDELLERGGHPVALERQLALRHLDALLAAELAVAADHLHHLLPLPADPRPRVRVDHVRHVLPRLLHRPHPGLPLLPALVVPHLARDLVLEDAALGALRLARRLLRLDVVLPRRRVREPGAPRLQLLAAAGAGARGAALAIPEPGE